MRIGFLSAVGAALLMAGVIGAGAPSSSTVTHHTATTHAMRYHVALPSGWSADRTWPVLVVIPDASRDFVGTLEAFAAARRDRPLILVAPEVLSCGGARTRVPERYSYARAVWDSVQGGDDFAFDEAGTAAVLADVRRTWHGAPTAFLTGWEAGGHTVWALAFRHPERWRGVAPVTPNYLRRGLDARSFSTAPERARLPLQVFWAGSVDPAMEQALQYFRAQTDTALADARAHGFAPATIRTVAGAPHGPLAEAVLAWADSLRKTP